MNLRPPATDVNEKLPSAMLFYHSPSVFLLSNLRGFWSCACTRVTAGANSKSQNGLSNKLTGAVHPGIIPAF